jgi:hypothetical protein
MPRTLASPLFFAMLLASDAVAADVGAPTAGGAPAASRYVLEIGGAHVDIDEAVVVSEKIGDGRDPYIQRPAAGKRDEIAMRGGAALARDLSRFYEESFTKECVRRVDGNFIFAEHDYSEISRLTFSWGIVTEVGFPALDRMTKGLGVMTLKLQPEFPRRILQHGTPLTKPQAGPVWVHSAFKLSIEGLEPALKSVRQGGELGVTQTPTTTAPVQCAPPVVSDLSFTIPLADAAAVTAWKEGAPRRGTLEYLAGDGSPVMKLKLNGVKKKGQASEADLAHVTASIDSIGFDAASARTPASPGTK